MKKRNILNSVVLYTCIVVLQILWLPLGAIGFVSGMICKIAEIAHEEMCMFVDILRCKL